ncbi:DUF4440 domain-containing protein [Xanthomonas sp. Kuri4-2]
MKITSCVAGLLLAHAAHARAASSDEAQVRAADTRFWQAYNACDLVRIGPLLTPDVEFYHDKGGLTASRDAVVTSLRRGPCGDPHMHLRREATAGSLAFHPLAGGYALLSGTHRFYVQDGRTPERLDGQARFTTLWKLDAGTWRLHRVLSYDHGPVAYVPPPVALTLPAATLATYAGRYRSPLIGDIVVAVDGDHLALTAGDFVATLHPETRTRFFALERDLRFEFEGDAGRAATGLVVYENGVVSERAPRSAAP